MFARLIRGRSTTPPPPDDRVELPGTVGRIAAAGRPRARAAKGLIALFSLAAISGLTLAQSGPGSDPIVRPADAPDGSPGRASVQDVPPAASSSPPRPVVLPAARPMPPEFEVLLRRSIFTPRRPSVPGLPGGAAPAREGGLVLRGVMVQGDRFTALVEDVPGRRVLHFRAGDAVASGRLGHVGLNGVEYKAGDRATQVSIGDALTGEPAAVPAATKRTPRS